MNPHVRIGNHREYCSRMLESDSAPVSTSRRKPHPCLWCGAPLTDSSMGRRRRYCKQSCRQRAYESRNQTLGTSIPEDSIILSRADADNLADRLFTLRCAAEDVSTAVNEKASHSDLVELCEELLRAAVDADRMR